jgi:hypothetical protein
MHIEKIDKNIAIFKDFITLEESTLLLNLAKNSTESEWSNYNYTQKPESDEWDDRILILDKCSGFNQELRDLVNNIFDRIKTEVYALLQKDYDYVGFATIYRSVIGQEMKTHNDSGLGPSFKYGVVLYLNDDYDGGEIYYPNMGIEIKPEARSMVIHPAHEAYRHGVKKVLAGTRYSMTSFLRLKFGGK